MTNFNFLSKSSSQSCGHSSVTLASTVGSPSAHRRSTMLRLLSVLVLVLTFGVGNVWGATAAVNSQAPANGRSFIIALYYNSEYYALPHGFTSAGTVAGKQCTLNANGKVTAIADQTSPDDCLWTFTSATGGYKLSYVNNNTTYYVWKTATSGSNNYNIQCKTTDSDNIWAFTAGTANSKTAYSVQTTKTGATANNILMGNSNSTFQVRGTTATYAITLLEVAPAVAYTVTLMDDNSTRTEASPGAGVTLPSRDGCAGYTFAGWTKTWTSTQTSWTTTAPTIIPAGSYTPAADENLYPVYTKTEGGESTTATITASNFTNLGSNNYGSGAERTGTVGTISLGGHYITGNNNNIQCQANNANIYNKTAFPGKITKVELNQTGTVAFSLYVGSEQLMSSSETGTGQTPSGTKITDVTSANKMTWNVSGNYTYFDIKKGGSAGYISSIVVTYDPSTISYISVPNCCQELGQIKGSFNEATQTTGVLRWKQLSDKVDSWAVTYRVKNSGDAFAAVSTSATTTEVIETVTYNKYTITGLQAGKTYEFKITPTLKSGICTPLESDLIVEGSTPAAYTITAGSNNTDYGTVSLSGTTITATLADYCRYATPAYTVVSGTATVAQGTGENVNKFTVTPSANCSIRINFEPIPVTGVTIKESTVEVSALSLEVGGSTTLTAAVAPNTANPGVNWTVTQADNFISFNTSTGAVSALKAGTATITATSTLDNTKTASCTVTVVPVVEYKKVTANLDDWSGEYLLVYDNSESEAWVWTGVDATSCYASTTISSNKITRPSGAVKLTIAAMIGGYSILVNGGTNDGKYIGRTANSNGMNIVDSEIANTLTYENSAVTITSNNLKLRFNSNSDQKRFRYFTSDQQVVQLYRKVVTSAVTITAPTTGTGTLALANGQTPVASGDNVEAGAELTVNAAPNTGNHYIGGTITVTKTVGGDDVTAQVLDGTTLTMPEYAITVSASFTPTYAITGASVEGGSFSWKDEYENENPAYVAAGVYVQASANATAGYVFGGTFDIYQTGTPATKVTDADGLFEMPAYAVTIGGTFNQAPSITLSQTTPMAFSKVATGASTSETFTVNAANLTVGSLSVAKDGTNPDKFNLSVSSIDVTAGAVTNFVVTVTPVTSVAGDYSATITVDDGEGGAAAQSFNVTLHVEDQYTAKWWVNGVEQTASTVTDFVGTALEFPAEDPSATGDCEGLVFQGWKVGVIDGTAASAPSYVNTGSATMPVNGVNYYAVFAEESSSDETESVTWSTRYDEQTDVEGEELAIGASAKVTFNKGTNSNKCQYYTTGYAIRVYGGGNFVVSAPGTMTNITLTFGTGDNNNAITANVGTYSDGSWEGEANSVTFSIGGTSNHRRIAGISVTYSASSLAGWVTTCPHCDKVTLQKAIVGEGAEAAGNAIAFSPAVTSVKTCEAAEVTVVPTIATGWELTNVAVAGVADVTYNAGVISIPQGKEGTLNVTATFSQINYSVDLSQSPAVGATLSGAADDAHYGETINLSATNIPASALFVNWTSSDVTITNPTSATEASFTMPAKDVTVTANFNEVHDVAWANENTPAEGKSDFVYVKGIVTGITEMELTQYHNATYYISDLDENGAAVNSYLVFRAKKEGNTNYTSTDELKEGDEVIVYGKLTNYQGTKEFDQGGYIIANGRTEATFDVVVSGTATKTDYFASETFAYAGLTAKAEYSTGYKKNVTAAAIWKANNVASYTVTADETINVTATWNETTSEAFPVTVTVTTKVLESIELSETELTGYKGIALPKPTAVMAHFDDQGVKSTEPVTAFATFDSESAYDASSTEEQTITVSYQFGITPAETADYTVTLSPVRNTLETAYTVAKGIEIIDVDRVEGNNLALDESANKAFVAGLVTAVSSNTYTIKDNAGDAAFIEIYEGTLGSGISSVVVGDRIKVEGNFFFYENNTHTVQKHRIVNGEIVRVSRTPNFTIADVAEMEVNITADLAEDDLTIDRGGSEGAITFSCTDPAVTIVENKLHAAAAGDATVTATMAASGEGAMSFAEATTTFNVHVIAERTRYAVICAGNGADGGSAPVIANQLPDVPVDLPANTFTYTDMRFTGWVVTETESGDAVAVEDGHFTMPEAAVTLTAQWVAKSYCALTLRINGVDQTPFDVERLEAYDLSEHTPETTNGYAFYGWAALESDVEEEVTEAITILPNHIFTPAADEASKTLYAVFTKSESGANKHYVLDYTTDVADKSISYGTEVDVTATDGSQWVVMASKQQSMQINTGKDAYIQVPNCPADIVSIVLSCRSGATAAAAFSETSDGEAIVTATGTTTQTLNFSGVTASAGYIIPYEGNCQITHVDVEYNGNFTYYTTRPVVRHMVTYDANGGSNAPAATKANVDGKAIVTSAVPTAPEGKEFYCWNANAEGTGAIYWAGDKVAASEADVTIYAVWRDLPTTEAIATIGGKFIINNLGDTAVFSRGNVQHQQSTNTWRCAPNQYDWAGEEANEQMGNPNYDGWVDLFSWSIGEENNYGATSAYHPSLYFNKEFVDWGSLFTGDWSTLSINEWYFMLYNRPNANNLWGMAMIGDTLGMVLLPGDWTAPSGVTFVPGTMPTTDMWEDADCLDPTQADQDHWRLNKANMPANKFTEEEWAILEEAGAVFCPYGGRRSGGYGNHTNRLDETVDYEYNYTYWENYYGAYWTSTVHNAAEGKVYWLPMICGGCDSDHENWGRGSHGWWENGRYGHSVRLVTRIPRQYTVTYDANGATSGSVPVNENTYLDGATVPVAAKGDLAKEGYAFAGWKFKGTTYKAGDTYTISNVKYNENIVFEAQWNAPSDYVLVTKETQLAAGDQIIIAAAGNYDYAMGTQNGDIRNRVEIAKTDDKKRICMLTENPVVFTLGITDDGKYTFNDGTGYLCATTGSNKIGTQTDLNDNGKWAISVSTDANGVVKASVVAQGSLTNKTLQYNSGSPRFSCYSAASLQAVALYKIPGNVEVPSGNNIGTEDIAQNSNVTLDNGTMTVNEDKELNNLTLGLHAVVNVQENKTLETNDLTIKSTAGESTQMTGVVENVTYSNFYMEVTFYNSAETLDETTANQWYMISAPFDVALNGGFFQTNGTQMVLGQDFDLFEYDGSKRATTGVTGWARPQGVMHGGHACLIGFNPGQKTTIRLKAMTTHLANPTSITLNEYTGESEANSNWNGVANPTMRHINFDRDVQTYDNDARGYQTYSYEENSFVVGRAFFVHGTGTVDLSAATHPVYAPVREAAEKKYSYCVRLASENSNWANQMYVRASEEASASYEAGHDLETMNGTSGINALLWTNNYGMRLAIEEAPLVNDQAAYELGLYAPADGQYTLSTPTQREDAVLYLTLNGSIIWNLSLNPYELTLTRGQNEGYGLRLIANPQQMPTEIGNVQGDNVQCTKVLIDDHIYILRGEKLFDATGKVVK